jgi:mannobiose 2-epimerase
MIRFNTSHFVVSLALVCALSGVITNRFVAAPAASTGTTLAPSPGAYRAVARQTNQSLTRDVLTKWFPAAVDTRRGGFHQNYATNWKRNPGDERSIVYQSRLTWLSAQAAQRFSTQKKRYIQYSNHGASFLRDRMWDKQFGGFYWELNGAGRAERNGEKHAYGNAFAIYALCANYRASRDPRALELAQRSFAWLERHAHDARNGGYYEALSRSGKILLSPSVAAPRDFIGTRYGFKSMNTHIHLLEAFSSLYEIAPTPLVRRRLQEVFLLVRDTINVPSVGAMNMFFTPEWRAVPDVDSFGHDIETAYLLVEASHALGRPNDERTWAAARRLVDHTLEYGFDATRGGVYNDGSAFREAFETGKGWWSQAEGLNALLLMHERYGRQTPRYWNAFVKQWNFIRRYQIDATNGGWRPSVSAEGQATPGQNKSDRWTEGYHQGRALLNVSATLWRLSNENR